MGVLGVILAQMSLKEGLRQFGDRTEAAATREMKQLHDMETFFPRDPKTLTREERIKALSSLIFIVGVPSKVNGGKTSATGKRVTWPRQLANTIVCAASTLI